MRRLTVLSVAYPMAAVGPDAVGGAEQVLSALDHALVAAGHRSVVVACEGSEVAGRHYAYPGLPDGRAVDDEAVRQRQAWVRDRIARALAEQAVDVIHMHGLDFHAYLAEPGVAVLATLHLPPDWYAAEALAPARPRTWVHCVSDSQAAAMPPGAPALPPIANGVDVGRLGAEDAAPGGFALTLARICPEKGLHLALDAARAANHQLLIAGEVYPYAAHQAYFRDEVSPRLDRRRRFLGPVGFERKRHLLSAARCLIIPSLAAETSSLVAMEAASCGTPVIAFRRGALPEIVEDGRTGFLVEDVAGIAEALGRVDRIDRAACRAAARRRFCRSRMAAAYIERYQRLASPEARAAA